MLNNSYPFFVTNKLYYRGDRVSTYSTNLKHICSWECLAPTYSSLSLNPYTYLPTREKQYHWKQLCCEESALELPTPVYYGLCTTAIPRATQQKIPQADIAQEDYYENEIFI